MDVKQTLSELVRIDSVSARSNREIADYLAARCERLSFRVRRFPYADERGTEKVNLVACAGWNAEDANEVELALVGHTDTVPFDPGWSEALNLTERDGRLYGRGACDTKAFIAAALAAVEAIDPARLARPLALVFTADEEVGCLGAPPMIEAMLAGLPRPEAVIVGEPTSMRVVTGHKASWGMRVHVRGHEVHSSLIHTGVSAVMAAARLVAWMDDAMAESARAAVPNGYDPPYTTLHVGLIAGGTAGNITARDCAFTGEIRIAPGETIAGWKGRFMDEVARLEAELRRVHP
ncbi:MAG TPA: M20/M25/M40 family metallo-hydrolase, partial [Pyrinomonadaceae bacterium]